VEERAEFARRIAGSDYDQLLQTRLAYGTPEAVIGRLGELRDELGLSGFLLEPNVGGAIPRDLVFKSVRLFAEKVAPALHAQD
jgi:alkanesulfonate monooxygenase SsuD/methylene tetrahydromethanopterin reductase-like flavin-dependent oxidoreductase (luciferase family)